MSRRMYTINDIQFMVDTLISSNTLLPGLYQSTNNICAIFTAIIESRGQHWTNHVRAISWTDEEKQKFEHLFQPYIPHILAFFNGMKGGAPTNSMLAAAPVEAAPVDAAPVEAESDAESEADVTSDAESDVASDAASEPDTSTASEATSDDKTPDSIFVKILDAFKYVDSVVAEMATEYGILKYETKADTEEDYHLIPPAISSLLTPIIGPLGAEGLKEIKVPLRLLITLIYLFLDMTRMAAATAGQEQARKTLSIAVALIDILRGDWKRGITSIMGYFGTAPLFMGQLAKSYLFLFQMLSPRIQENFVYGAFDAVKSFMIGVLLTIFKVSAPFSIRKTVIEVFETIAKHKKDIDGTLEAADLNPLPTYMMPSFNDLNNLQGIMDDPAFLCSKEHQELVKSINQSYMLNILLQIARIPVTEQFIKWKCDGKPVRSFVEELADRQRKPNKKKNAAAAEASRTPVEASPAPVEASPTPVEASPTPVEASPALTAPALTSPATAEPSPATAEPSPATAESSPATAEPSPTEVSPPALTASAPAPTEPSATESSPATAEPSPAPAPAPAAPPAPIIPETRGGKRSLRMASAFIA
jgi:hypothetical protein